jgi:hypothetical protein
MNAGEAAHRLAECFRDAELPYAIGGALALSAWGAPRATKDIDGSVFVTEDQLARVVDALERAGVIVDRASVGSEVARIGLFRGRLGTTVVDVFISQHPQSADMRARAQTLTDGSGRSLCFISPEDLCIHKLIYGRPKDVIDLERLLAVRSWPSTET